MSQKVRDVIPVLRITPIATQPSAVSASLASPSAIALCRAQTCAHSGIAMAIHFGQLGFYTVGQKFEKNRIFDHFENLRHYISATVINRGI